jgi:lysozyme family protein
LAKFQPALENTMQFEDPQRSGKITEDGGGRTRFGIAEKFHPDLPVEFFSAEKDEALALAESLLENEYWERAGLAEIEDQAVANKLFDMAVNMGLHQAAVYVQRAANAAFQISGAQSPGAPNRLEEDGLFGENTVAAINSLDPAKYAALLREFSAVHYRHIAGVNPAQSPNLEAWLKRAAA